MPRLTIRSSENRLYPAHRVGVRLRAERTRKLLFAFQAAATFHVISNARLLVFPVGRLRQRPNYGCGYALASGAMNDFDPGPKRHIVGRQQIQGAGVKPFASAIHPPCRKQRIYIVVALALIPACSPALAQTNQFLPEIDLYSRMRDNMRFEFQAKQTREANVPVQAELGPSIELYVHPLAHLADIARFDLDDAKARVLVLAGGYRYLPEANGAPATNRIEPVATVQFPFTRRLALSDRNRFDLDWKSHEFTWRYRNKFQIEGPVKVRSYHFSPFASAELFYQSSYGKVSDTAIYAGCIFRIRKHVQLEPYYEHQNETGKKPNNQLDQFGIILNLFL